MKRLANHFVKENAYKHTKEVLRAFCSRFQFNIRKPAEYQPTVLIDMTTNTSVVYCGSIGLLYEWDNDNPVVDQSGEPEARLIVYLNGKRYYAPNMIIHDVFHS